MSTGKRGRMGDAVARRKQIRGQKKKPAPAPVPAAPMSGRRRITVYLGADLYAQARACILALGAAGREPATISSLLDGALERELLRLAKRHRDGEAWLPHRGRLPGGRPPSR